MVVSKPNLKIHPAEGPKANGHIMRFACKQPLKLTNVSAPSGISIQYPLRSLSKGHYSFVDVVAMICLAILFRVWSFGISVIDWDESLYVVMAQRWLAGDLPYVSVWDQHPIGLPALFSCIGWFTENILTGARLAATLSVGATAALLHVTAPATLQTELQAGWPGSFTSYTRRAPQDYPLIQRYSITSSSQRPQTS